MAKKQSGPKKPATSRPARHRGTHEFFVMDIDYGKSGSYPWHWVEARPILAYSVLNTPKPLATTWNPLKARIVRDKVTPDIFGFSGRFALNERALSVLRPFLGREVEALLLDLPKAAKDVAPLVVLHALGGKIDCGADMFADADDYVFRKKDVNARQYFESCGRTFVSVGIREAVEEAGMRGVSFYKPKYKVRG